MYLYIQTFCPYKQTILASSTLIKHQKSPIPATTCIEFYNNIPSLLLLYFLENIASRKEEIRTITKEKLSNSTKTKNIKNSKRRKIANKIYEFLVLNGLTIERRKLL